MNAIEFDVQDKSARISFKELLQTMELGDGFGDLPKQCPRQSGELIKEIVDSVEKYAGLEATVAPIVIREPYTQVDRKRVKSGDPLLLEDYVIKRLVSRIDIPLEAFEGEDKVNASIALSYAYTDGIKGIQIAFGENVHVCENLSTFGGFHFSTHGGSKVSFDEGMQLMHHWLQNLNQVHDAHINTIERLKGAKVARAGFQRIIGSLFEKAVRANNKDKILAPMNQTQVGSMVQVGVPVLKEDTEVLNGWDILNWGTQVLKPNNSDMVNLIEDTSAFNNFILNEFKIKFEPGI